MNVPRGRGGKGWRGSSNKVPHTKRNRSGSESEGLLSPLTSPGGTVAHSKKKKKRRHSSGSQPYSPDPSFEYILSPLDDPSHPFQQSMFQNNRQKKQNKQNYPEGNDTQPRRNSFPTGNVVLMSPDNSYGRGRGRGRGGRGGGGRGGRGRGRGGFMSPQFVKKVSYSYNYDDDDNTANAPADLPEDDRNIFEMYESTIPQESIHHQSTTIEQDSDRTVIHITAGDEEISSDDEEDYVDPSELAEDELERRIFADAMNIYDSEDDEDELVRNLYDEAAELDSSSGSDSDEEDDYDSDDSDDSKDSKDADDYLRIMSKEGSFMNKGNPNQVSYSDSDEEDEDEEIFEIETSEPRYFGHMDEEIGEDYQSPDENISARNSSHAFYSEKENQRNRRRSLQSEEDREEFENLQSKGRKSLEQNMKMLSVGGSSQLARLREEKAHLGQMMGGRMHNKERMKIIRQHKAVCEKIRNLEASTPKSESLVNLNDPSEGHNFAELEALWKILMNFLRSAQTTYAFTPMNSSKRLQTHKLCAMYKLKTKSNGEEPNRCLNVAKSNKTLSADEFEEREVLSKIEKLVRIESKKRPGSTKAERRRRKRDQQDERPAKFENEKKNARFRQGELIGVSAPEIDDGNLGKQLLRSLGWNGGGLGADGQGIALPIGVVFKKNKRGIGC